MEKTLNIPEGLKRVKVELSIRSVIITVAILVAVVVAWNLNSIFFLFFIAYILNAAFRPLVDWLEARKVPRGLSITLIYLMVFGILGLLLVSVFNQAATQLTTLLSQLPNIVYNLITNLNSLLPQQFNLLNPDTVKDSLVEIVGSLLKFDANFFTTGLSSALGILGYAASAAVIFGTITILWVFLLGRKEDIVYATVNFLDSPTKEKYRPLMSRISNKLGAWLRAQVFLMALVATIIWFGLSLPVLFIPGYTIHNYALPIATLVFILEVAPGTGIGMGGVLSTLIALATGNLFLIIYIPLLFILTQQLESLVIIPKTMKRVIGLDPVITILAVLSGYLLFQVVGAILIIPMLAVVKIILDFKSEEISKSLKENIH